MQITDSLPLNVIIHVLILFSILSAFFFFHVTKIMKAAFNSEFDKLGDVIVEKVSTAPAPVKDFIRKLPLTQMAALYAEEDEVMAEHNKWVARIPLFILLSLVLILTMPFITCHFCFDMKGLWIHNLVIFAFVGAIEIAFFYFIASKYIPVPPSTLVKTAFAQIQKNFGAPSASVASIVSTLSATGALPATPSLSSVLSTLPKIPTI
jgi:hypothetical protein